MHFTITALTWMPQISGKTVLSIEDCYLRSATGERELKEHFCNNSIQRKKGNSAQLIKKQILWTKLRYLNIRRNKYFPHGGQILRNSQHQVVWAFLQIQANETGKSLETPHHRWGSVCYIHTGKNVNSEHGYLNYGLCFYAFNQPPWNGQKQPQGTPKRGVGLNLPKRQNNAMATRRDKVHAETNFLIKGHDDMKHDKRSVLL